LSNGAIIEFYNLSVAGKLVIRKGDVNMVLNSYQDKTSIQTQFSWCKLIKVANNTYDIMSDTAFLVFDPLVIPPGWQNTLSSGNRNSSITITFNVPISVATNTTLVDGIIAGGGNQSYFQGQPTANQFIKFQFLEAKKIQGFKTVANVANGFGLWQFQGSTDDVTYTNVGSVINWGGSYTAWANGAIDTDTNLTNSTGATMQIEKIEFTNNSSYVYYRLVYSSGSTNSSTYLTELFFKIN
jgi:hypothetical protein